MTNTPNSFKSVKRGGIVDDIIEIIKQALITDELKPGQRLPSEMELMEQFGVSRNSLREAIKMLDALGVVDVRRGDGTYIASESSSRNLRPLIFAMLLKTNATKDLVELRTLTEVGYCQLAGSNGTEEDFKMIESAATAWEAEALKEERDYDLLIQLDLQFHQSIIRATHNELVILLADTVEEMFFHTVRDAHTQDEVIRFGVEGHRKIAEVLKTRDSDRIRDVVTYSLKYWRDQFLKKKNTSLNIPGNGADGDRSPELD
ncbi:FadR family transcriptional regulator [Phototrophicus methaneseepsis]|uniref:FadR family transcriptional regulator n=1 Tax=Phototrophicus methaneseepsis TaxID=2710758 RepID=A0A7S8IDZ6_9CHLR|nr:FadR/GntR family transcriptional regulator [Phototrophicus methaneseepsis]QPC81328.1 FadR family transcriptional regulator [Phototrophicus methaneseepsis]